LDHFLKGVRATFWVAFWATLVGVLVCFYFGSEYSDYWDEGGWVSPIILPLFSLGSLASGHPEQSVIFKHNFFLVIYQALGAYMGGFLVTVWRGPKRWHIPLYSAVGSALGLIVINAVLIGQPVHERRLPVIGSLNSYLYPFVVFLFAWLGTWVGYRRYNPPLLLKPR
jgi:hypothetical protein